MTLGATGRTVAPLFQSNFPKCVIVISLKTAEKTANCDRMGVHLALA